MTKNPIVLYKGHTGWKVKTRLFGTLLVSLSAVAIAESVTVVDAHAAATPLATAVQPAASKEPETPNPAGTPAAADTQSTAKVAPVAESTPVETTTESGDYPVLSQDKSTSIGADTTQVNLSPDQIADHFTATVENRNGNDEDSDTTDNIHTQQIGKDGSVTLTSLGSHDYYSSPGQAMSITGHQAAHVSFEHEIDFSHDFSMIGYLGAGTTTQGGADSVGFIFAPGDPAKATHGGSGGQLGLAGLDNAFGFIFDEYYNKDFHDPSTDPYIGWRYTDANGDLQSASSSDWYPARDFGLKRTSTPDNYFEMTYDAGTHMLTVELNNRSDFVLQRHIQDVSTGYSLSISASTGGNLNDYSAKIEKFSYKPKTIPLGVTLVDEAKGESTAELNNAKVNAIANIGDTISIFSTQAAAKRAIAADKTLDPSLVAVIPSDKAGNVYVIDGSKTIADNTGTVHTIAGASGKTVADSTYYSYTVKDGDGQAMTVPVRLAFKATVTPINAETKQPIEGVDPVTVVAVAGEPVLVSFPGYTPTQMVINAPTDGQEIAQAQLPINVKKTGDTATTTTDEAVPIGHDYTATGMTVDGKPVNVTATVGTGESITDALNAQDLTNGGEAVTSGGKSGIDSTDYTWSAVGNAAATDATDVAQPSGSILVPTQATLAYWYKQAEANQTTADDYRQRSQDLYNEFVGLSGLSDAQKASADKLLASVVAIYTQVSDTNGQAKASFEKAEAETVPAVIYQEGQDGYKSLEAVKNLLISFQKDLDSLKTTNKAAQDTLTTFDSWTRDYKDPRGIGFPNVTFGPDFGNVSAEDLKGLDNPDYYSFVDAKNPDIQVKTPKNAGSYVFNLTAAGRAYLKGISTNANAGLYISAMLTINPLATTDTVNGATMVYGGDQGQLPTFTVKSTTTDGAGQITTTEQTPTQTDLEVVDSTGTVVPLDELQAGVTYTIQYTKAAQAALMSDTNYKFTPFGTGKLTVRRRPITVTASGNVKTYGDSDPKLSLTTDSSLVLVNGDSIDKLVVTLKRTGDENAGDYQIVLDQAKTTNYAVTVNPGTFTIAKKKITVQIGSDERTYGSADPKLTLSIPKMVNGQDNGTSFNETADALKVTLTRAAGEDVGDHAITGSVAADSNYAVTFEDGTDTVTAANASVTTNDATMIYGGETPTFTASVKGLTLDPLPQKDFEIYDTIAKNTVTADQVQVKGTYEIHLTAKAQATLSNDNPNYDFAVVNSGKLTVYPRSITVTAKDESKIYGNQDPDFVLRDDLPANLGNNDHLSGLGVKLIRSGNENVGTYRISADPNVVLNPNYKITVKSGNFTITKRPVTVKINPATKVFGGKDPQLSFTVLSNGGKLLRGDMASVLGVTLTSEDGAKVGDYVITGTAATNTNYDVTIEGTGTLSVLPADGNVTIGNATVLYGETPVFTGTLTTNTTSDLGDHQDYFEILNLADNQLVAASAVQVGGKYQIQLTQAAQEALKAANSNYALGSFGTATLTVKPRPVTVRVNNQVTYNGAPITKNDATLVGGSHLKPGETIADLKLTYAMPSNPTVGTYAISGVDNNSNYQVTILPGIWTVLGKTSDDDGNVTIIEKDPNGKVTQVTKQWNDGSQTVDDVDPVTGTQTVTETKPDQTGSQKTIDPKTTRLILPDGDGSATVVTIDDSGKPAFKHYGIDPDKDGVDSYQELIDGTDPMNPDSDGDGVSDGEEMKRGTNPLKPDLAGGVSGGQERRDHTTYSKAQRRYSLMHLTSSSAVRHAQQRQSLRQGSKQMTLPQTNQKDDRFLAVLGTILLSGLMLPFTRKRH